MFTSDTPCSRAHWIQHATQRLQHAGVDSPRLSAECLLCHVCAITRVALATWPETVLTEAEAQRLEGLLRRREDGEPVAYLLGSKEFFGRAFRVTPATLIPRPETEHLVEAALRALPNNTALRFADLGTGSGCIAVTLCLERPAWHGLAVDRSPRALHIARQNAKQHGVAGRMDFVRADFNYPLCRPASLDLLVSNPPYVGKREYAILSPEVRDFEPVTALVPNFIDNDRVHSHDHTHDHEDHEHAAPASPLTSLSAPEPESLDHLKAVAHEACIALKPKGVLLMEHGYTQGEALALWLEEHTWRNVAILQDLSGKNRLVRAERPAV